MLLKAQPFLPSSFDCLPYAKTEREGLVHTSVNGIRQRQTEGGVEEVPHQKNAFHAHILHFEQGAVHFVNVQNSSTWGRNYRIKPQPFSFNGTPPLSTQVVTAVIHVIKWTRSPPSVFAYYKRSKTGSWEGLGTRLERNGQILSELHGDLFNCKLLCCTVTDFPRTSI